MTGTQATGTDGLHVARELRDLHEAGVCRILALVRHAEREFATDVHDLENPLTDAGRAAAAGFGEALPPETHVRAYASPAERCLETAALALEAHRKRGGPASRHRPVEGLGVFYILDQRKMWRAMQDHQAGNAGFLEDWFRDRLEPDIMLPARTAAAAVMRLCATRLVRPSVDGPSLDLCVTHDMTLYLVRDRVLGLDRATAGEIPFLDGVILFEQDGEILVKSHQSSPRPLAGFLELRKVSARDADRDAAVARWIGEAKKDPSGDQT